MTATKKGWLNNGLGSARAARYELCDGVPHITRRARFCRLSSIRRRLSSRSLQTENWSEATLSARIRILAVLFFSSPQPAWGAGNGTHGAPRTARDSKLPARFAGSADRAPWGGGCDDCARLPLEGTADEGARRSAAGATVGMAGVRFSALSGSWPDSTGVAATGAVTRVCDGGREGFLTSGRWASSGEPAPDVRRAGSGGEGEAWGATAGLGTLLLDLRFDGCRGCVTAVATGTAAGEELGHEGCSECSAAVATGGVAEGGDRPLKLTSPRRLRGGDGSGGAEANGGRDDAAITGLQALHEELGRERPGKGGEDAAIGGVASTWGAAFTS